MVLPLLFFATSLYSMSNCYDIRVMTFDTWLQGSQVNNGIQKIAKHIELVDPDIVALTEINSATLMKNITDLLSGTWSFQLSEKAQTAVLTKHKFSASFNSTATSNSMNAIVELSNGNSVNFWAVKADGSSSDYGPLTANLFRTKPEQLMKFEKTRESTMRNIANSTDMQSAVQSVDTVPIILAGTLNSPFHQDWIEQTSHTHNGWTFEWPTTEVVVDEMGMTDSFRYLHPDVLANPGNTWSTCKKIVTVGNITKEEPQDRIDYIFYRGPLVPLLSRTYSGDSPISQIPNHKNNDWPSDAAAAVTDFRFETAEKTE